MATDLDPTQFLLSRLKQAITNKLYTNISNVAVPYPEYLAELVDQVFEQVQKDTPPSPQPEIVRVMRLYVFEGERKAIEKQLLRSLGDGSKLLGGVEGIKIHVATIGSFPEILK